MAGSSRLTQLVPKCALLVSSLALASAGACSGEDVDRCASGSDLDSDGVSDVCDDDIDGDLRLNEDDLCPESRTGCDLDTDGDNIANQDDLCPTVRDPDQDDLDNDDIGDACDPDMDGDTVPNTDDNCERTANTDQNDLDDDGTGDACDLDRDGDDHGNDTDNCPDLANPDQEDVDDDGIGDLCDDLVIRTGQSTNPECKQQGTHPTYAVAPVWNWPEGEDLASFGFETKTEVYNTPVVADVDADGEVEVVFSAHSVSGTGALEDGALVIADGATGDTEVMVSPPGYMVSATGGMAVANLDGDATGYLEIVVHRSESPKGLMVFSHEGERLWSCTEEAGGCYDETYAARSFGAPAIADLDGDRVPELILGATVYERQASGAYLRAWQGTAGTGGHSGINTPGAISYAVDLDGDGGLEVLAGRGA